MSIAEREKHKSIRDGFTNAIDYVSQQSFGVSEMRKAAFNSTIGSYDGVDLAVTAGAAAVGGLLGGIPGAVALGSAGGLMRSPVVPHMRTLMANLSTNRDFEIFKRNIYPGNGLGISQFMGGDIDTGWSTLASLSDPSEDTKLQQDRRAYMSRLGDAAWSRALNRSQDLVAGNQAASGGQIMDSSNAIGTSQLLSGVAAIAGVGLMAAGMPMVGGSVAGMGLLGVTNGRAATSVFEAMGLVSRLDDDMPGFDEVSFRAQTYMRSVWDMFQTCARLLPNYIVAVRPFEDRSTVFYGKPHWLYTSGVVPVSTGFMHPDSALKAGVKVSGPRYQSPDQGLLDLLDEVNKAASPMADAAAYAEGFEPLKAIEQELEKQQLGMDEYAPVTYVRENYKRRLINFYDPRRSVYVKDGEIVARLPLVKGNVNVGFHLPFGKTTGTSANIAELAGHKQTSRLPYRYQFPYFTDRETAAFDGRHSGYAFSYSTSELLAWENTIYDNIRVSGGQSIERERRAEAR